MIENIPKSVRSCITLAVSDILGAVKETGAVSSKDVKAMAANMEKFALGMVASVMPKTRSEWLSSDANESSWVNRNAAPVQSNPQADRIRMQNQITLDYVRKNLTKQNYEELIGADKAAANALRQKFDNDPNFATTYPDLAKMLESGIPAPSAQGQEAPAAMGSAEPLSEAPAAPAAPEALPDDGGGTLGLPPDLGALLGEESSEALSEAPVAAEGDEAVPEQAVATPAPAGQPATRHDNMDIFNTDISSLEDEKPEAVPQRYIK